MNMPQDVIYKLESGSGKEFLVPYRRYRIRENLLVARAQEHLELSDENLLEKGFFKKVVNAKPMVPHFRYVASDDLPVAGAEKDLSNVTTPNWQNWLLPDSGQIYKALLTPSSSHYTEWKITILGTPQGRLRNLIDADVHYTSDDIYESTSISDGISKSPLGDVHPSFKIFNYSQTDMSVVIDAFAQMNLILGDKYSYITINEKIPENYDTIVLADAGTS